MTREEAIAILEDEAYVLYEDDSPYNRQAFDMAIEALEEQKTGKWIPWKAYYGKERKSWSDELKCSECGFKWGDEEYKFCPMCGAEMEV